MDSSDKIAIRLSVIIVILSTIATFGGLFFSNIYRDNEFIKSVWFGNDVSTLFIIVPTMIASLFYMKKNSYRARLIWMGTLWYMLYNYIFYMYGAVFNKFFLLYVFIFTLSVYALILAIIQTDRKELLSRIKGSVPVKLISSFMIFFALIIGGLWIAQVLSFMMTNQVPPGITQTGHPAGVVFATDLSLLVSTLIVGAVLLWKKNYWGYLVSTISMTKCVFYPIVLVIGGFISYNRTGIWDAFMPVYIILWIGCLIAFVLLVKGIGTKDQSLNKADDKV